MRKKIAIVGSAAIEKDESSLIDSCDLVVRFNNCKVYGGHSGKKLDILCLNVGGAPACQMVAETTVLKSSFYSLISEIWIPIQTKVCQAHMMGWNLSDPRIDASDLSDEIIESNKLGHLPTVRFSTEFNIRVFEMLRKRDGNFVSPSTGFLAIQYVVDESRFAEWDKLIFGFAFKGWKGHPFAAEEKLVMQYAAERQDVKFFNPKEISL